MKKKFATKKNSGMEEKVAMSGHLRPYSSRQCDENSPDLDYGILFFQKESEVGGVLVPVAYHSFYKRSRGSDTWHRQDGQIQEICAKAGRTRYYVMLDVKDSPEKRSSDWNIFVCRNQDGGSTGFNTHASPFNSADTARMANVDSLQSARIREEEFEEYDCDGGRYTVDKRVILIRRRIFLEGSFRSTASWRIPSDTTHPRLISDPEMEVSLKPS